MCVWNTCIFEVTKLCLHGAGVGKIELESWWVYGWIESTFLYDTNLEHIFICRTGVDKNETQDQVHTARLLVVKDYL